MKPLVYLAGPISGLTYAGATDWRQYAAKLLEPEIHALSPMRDKAFLAHLDNISGHGNEYKHLSPLATSKGVTTCDRFDCTRADVLLVNLLGAERVSIGTMIELGWADAARIPVVLVMEDGGLHSHLMVNEIVGYQVPCLDDGIALVKTVLGV